MVTFSEKLKKVFILIAGPLGCYATYHYLFILRYLDHSKYPLLTDMYGGISLIVDVSCAIIIAIISSLFLSKQKMLDNFKPRGPRLSIYIDFNKYRNLNIIIGKYVQDNWKHLAKLHNKILSNLEL